VAIPESFIQEVILRNPLEEIVSQYTTLKRAGSNMVACCPFHNEKTPSFTLYSQPSHFYCYGCGAGGDVITFVRRMENLDYPSAVEYLANRAGLPMPQQNSFEKRIDKKRYYEMNAAAARFWHETLLSPQGKAGRDYLQSRGLDLPIIKRFGLGYATLSWDALTRHLQKAGYRPEEIKENFLGGISSKGTLFDYFRGRAMFPIIDVAGNVVAFSGRLVESDRKESQKYFNTNDTPVFKKSRTVFALNLAKNSEEKELILCEGNMDVVSLHAHGISNAVASLGTALTSEQCRLLSRYTSRVVLCYDRDEAGVRATKKAIGLLQQLGIKVRVLQIPEQTHDGKPIKDPDDFIRLCGKGAFEKQWKDAPGALEYLFREIRSRHSLDSMDSKNAFIKECSTLLAHSSTVEQALYIGTLSRETGVPEEVLRASILRDNRRLAKQEEKNRVNEELKKSQGLGDRINPDKARFVPSAKKEESILGILLLQPEYLNDPKIRPRLEQASFRCEFCRRALSALLECSASEEAFSFSRLNAAFSPEEMGELEGMKKKRDGLGNHTAVLTELLSRTEEEKEKSERKEQPLSDDWLNRLRAEKEKKKGS
jgi:DNA primase